MPDATIADVLVLCRCFGERLSSERAYRLGCDKPGGCDELRDATDWPADA